jgi:hypothetical protein
LLLLLLLLLLVLLLKFLCLMCVEIPPVDAWDILRWIKLKL